MYVHRTVYWTCKDLSVHQSGERLLTRLDTVTKVLGRLAAWRLQREGGEVGRAF